MRVLVTGGKGFIGSHLMRMLDDAVSYDIKDGLDVLDVDTLREHADGCDVIVHLAALISQVESVENPTLYYLHNIEGTRRVSQVAREQGARLVFASSAAVYDWNANPYALSKWAGEAIVSTVPDHCALRFFNVYGPGDRPDTVIPTFIRGVWEGGCVIIYGDGWQTRDFIHVEDVCQIIKARLAGGEGGDVGTGVETAIIELARLVMKTIGQDVPIVLYPARQEVRHSVARQPLILSATRLEDGIRELVELL